MDTNKRPFSIFLAVACFSIIYAGCVFAQVARAVEKVSQNYIILGDDIKSYKIVYDPNNDKYYTTYSALIREKIKDRLKKIYSKYCGEGDVNLFFILNSDGALHALQVDPSSIQNEKLRDIAARGLKEASPLPSFPEELPYDRMLFSIIISFQKNNQG
jgi:hypothetical protein